MMTNWTRGSTKYAKRSFIKLVQQHLRICTHRMQFIKNHETSMWK